MFDARFLRVGLEIDARNSPGEHKPSMRISCEFVCGETKDGEDTRRRRVGQEGNCKQQQSDIC